METKSKNKRIKQILSCLLAFVMILTVAYFPVNRVKADENKTVGDLLEVTLAENPVKLYLPSNTSDEKYTVTVQVKAKETIEVENLVGTIRVDNTILTKKGQDLKDWDEAECIDNGSGSYTIKLNAKIDEKSGVTVNAGEVLFSIDFTVIGKASTTDIWFNNIDLKLANNVSIKTDAIDKVTARSDNAAPAQRFSIKFDQASYDTTEDTITVPVKITQNDGINNLSVQLAYNSTDLELLSFDWDASFKSNNTIIQDKNEGSGVITISALNGNLNGKNLNIVSDTLCNATFKINNMNTANEINVKVLEANNAGDDAVITNGNITCTVKKKLADKINYGDVNGDGKVTLVDAQWVLEACNHVRVLTPKQEAAAKVTGRSYVSLQDARAIMQKVTGKIATFPVQN